MESSTRRIHQLRNLLDRSQRATDDVTSIVKSTDAQLSELHSIMAPIQERTLALSNAHKNLSRCVVVVVVVVVVVEVVTRVFWPALFFFYDFPRVCAVETPRREEEVAHAGVEGLGGAS